MNTLKQIRTAARNLRQFPRLYSSSSSTANQTHVYTAEEQEQIKKIFRSLPSYIESIGKEDISHIFNVMKLPRTPEQLEHGYKFLDKFCGGRLSMSDLVRLVQTEHDPTQHLIQYAVMMDADKDGFISEDEYNFGIDTLKVWYPNLKVSQRDKVNYDKFLEEADTNKDGKVSVEELKAWLLKNS